MAFELSKPPGEGGLPRDEVVSHIQRRLLRPPLRASRRFEKARCPAPSGQARRWGRRPKAWRRTRGQCRSGVFKRVILYVRRGRSPADSTAASRTGSSGMVGEPAPARSEGAVTVFARAQLSANSALISLATTVLVEDEVTRVEPNEPRLGKVLQKGLCARFGEEWVVLAPNNQRFWLMLAESRLPAVIGGDVCFIVLE